MGINFIPSLNIETKQILSNNNIFGINFDNESRYSHFFDNNF